MSRSRVTIRDVASLAGVSHQTVSRVINHHERVDPETRKRVEEAIQRLGYSPNAIARIMVHGRTHTLACITPNLTDYTFAGIIEGAEAEARQLGYFLLSASAPDEETFAFLINQLIDSRRTDGLMVINPYADGRYKHVRRKVSTVYIGIRPRREKVDSVSLDEQAAGRIAALHLLELGHRHFAMITGPLCEDCSQDRQIGFLSAIQEAGLEVDPCLILQGDWSATSGYKLTKNLLEKNAKFTALFTQNDRMAVGAIRALREAGYNVPQNVSVIGFDDIPLASYFDPPLTTIRQDFGAVGKEAARLLISRLEQPKAPCRHLSLPVQLLVRGSTAPIG